MSNVSDSDQQDSMVNAAPSSASSYSAPHSSSSMLLKNQSLPLFHMMQTNAGPSHDYLQTLLNVNDELLAQSLASSANVEGEIDPDSSNTLSNTREYNITISTPPSSSNTSNTNAFVVQQQQLQLISPPLAEHDHQDAENIHSLLYSQQLQQDPLKPAIPPSTQQPQLITPPITPPEE